MDTLRGARVLVTGGSRRLGAALALDLAAHGADVAISYRSSAGDAEAVRSAVAAHGVRGVAVRADLARAADARDAVHAAADALGGLDGVVHSASGGFSPMPLARIAPEDLDEALGATLVGGLFVAQAAAERMADGGAVVFIGDVASIRSWPSFLPHCAAKGALRAVVPGLARALAPRHRVAIVHPGTVLPEDGREAEDGARVAREVPLGRVGEPADIAGAVRYLLTAPYVTGAELVVDGGRLAR